MPPALHPLIVAMNDARGAGGEHGEAVAAVQVAYRYGRACWAVVARDLGCGQSTAQSRTYAGELFLLGRLLAGD